MDAREILKDAKDRMEKSVRVFRDHLAKIRTGKASTGLVEDVQVNLYGVEQPMVAVANLMTPDPRTIAIQPYDKNAIPNIEKAILQADLGLNPVNDGTVVRISIPPLTEERRKEIVKVVHKNAEEARQAVRQIRRDANEHLKQLEKDKEISEDELHGRLDEVQKLTNDHVEQIDKIMEEKEQEVMEV